MQNAYLVGNQRESVINKAMLELLVCLVKLDESNKPFFNEIRWQ